MKKLLLLALVQISLIANLRAQAGNIDSLVISPANPGVTDTVTIYAYCSFSSGSCSLQSKTLSQVGADFEAVALHCTGMLSVICYQVDTFKILPQQVGNHQFKMTLLTGLAPNCAPALIQESDSLTYTVKGTAGINDLQNAGSVQAAYADGSVLIQGLPQNFGSYTLRVYASNGQLITHTAQKDNAPVRMELIPGLYVIAIEGSNRRLHGKLIVH